MFSAGRKNAGAPLTGIATPHEHDVLCGRGGGAQNHPGNVEYRALVAKNKKLYVILGKRDKNLLVDAIIKAVRSQNPPGRFLARDTANDTWYDIGKDKAFAKTAQALREGAPAIRISIERNKATAGLHMHDNNAHTHYDESASMGSPTKKIRKLVMEFPSAYEYSTVTNVNAHLQHKQHMNATNSTSSTYPHVTPDGATSYVSSCNSNAHMNRKEPYMNHMNHCSNNKCLPNNTMMMGNTATATTMADITDPILFFPDQLLRSANSNNNLEVSVSRQQQQQQQQQPLRASTSAKNNNNAILTNKLSASINEIIDDGVSDIFGDVYPSMECMENVMQKFDDSYRSQISTGACSAE
uniref:DUF6824 domain-containing protein n=1 Tax=Leptocylindrus danicus TaxID=163516 RepID=A0A7S2JRE5_9STRA|mmetsp:Transcript_1070/g.1538  ORF Transcript_1070/g.1538 Transcript_1070/m.1538 type:complete len:354 (+) Transcript_1070:127-1188(+)